MACVTVLHEMLHYHVCGQCNTTDLSPQLVVVSLLLQQMVLFFRRPTSLYYLAVMKDTHRLGI